MINYVDGDVLEQADKAPTKFIVHVCNDIGGWGAGFVLNLSKKWQAPEKSYRARAHIINGLYLGRCDFIQVANNIYVVNMVAQHGTQNKNNPIPIKYDAVRECLITVNKMAKQLNAEIHAPKFGAGLAGGDWNEIEKIINEVITVPITIYSFKENK